MGARSVLYLTCMLALAAWGATPSVASLSYGDLNNFDVFKDTTQKCHGFEIELDGIHSTDITYTYDWNALQHDTYAAWCCGRRTHAHHVAA